MAWGYEKCFVIEHDNTVKRRIDCKDCCYYESDDKSCMKRPLYLPVDGYNSWRNCDYFELDSSTSHYEEKKAQYASVLRRKATTVKSNISATKKTAPVSKPVAKIDKPKIEQSKPIHRGNKKYRVCEVVLMPKGKKVKYEYVEIFLEANKKRLIQVAFDDVDNVAYVNKKVYKPEAIELIKKVLQ